MSLNYSYLTALADRLTAQALVDGPGEGTVSLVRPGLLQEDREDLAGAAITLFEGDPEDESYRSLMVQEQARTGGGTAHQLLGGYVEIGSTLSTLNWHRFTAVLDYVAEGDRTRGEALAEADSVFTWLRRQIGAAQPWVLALEAEEDETAVQANNLDWTPIEAGGEGAHMCHARHHFQLLVHHAGS